MNDGADGPLNASVTPVPDSTSAAAIVAGNRKRRELIIQNLSTATLYIKFGSTAALALATVSATDCSLKIDPDQVITTAFRGYIAGVWSADTAAGYAAVTEEIV